MPEYRAWAQKQYKTARWRKMRLRQLKRHPLCQCVHCQECGLVADTVDHIKPHRGDPKLFWDERNIQSMNRDCHNRYKQSQERGGYGFIGVDVRGQPLDPTHPWYEQR